MPQVDHALTLVPHLRQTVPSAPARTTRSSSLPDDVRRADDHADAGDPALSGTRSTSAAGIELHRLQSEASGSSPRRVELRAESVSGFVVVREILQAVPRFVLGDDRRERLHWRVL